VAPAKLESSEGVATIRSIRQQWRLAILGSQTPHAVCNGRGSHGPNDRSQCFAAAFVSIQAAAIYFGPTERYPEQRKGWRSQLTFGCLEQQGHSSGQTTSCYSQDGARIVTSSSRNQPSVKFLGISAAARGNDAHGFCE
jgi:hypothetical protein